MKGQKFEEQAWQYLKKQGLTLITRNFSSRFGEIDLIALEKNYVIFIEVRYRKEKNFGSAAESIHHLKQNKIKKTAEYFLLHYLCYQQRPIRFDVIAMDDQNITWIKGAFY